MGIFLVFGLIAGGSAGSIGQPGIKSTITFIPAQTTQAAMYGACGVGCTCLTEPEAGAQFRTGYIRCSDIVCGSRDVLNGIRSQRIPMYCYRTQQVPGITAPVTIQTGTAGPVTGSTGSLYLTSSPPGATIRVDGEKYGVTPWTVEGLSEGYHSVRLTLAGHREFTQTPWVPSGLTTDVNATLEPLYSDLPVESMQRVTTGILPPAMPSQEALQTDTLNATPDLTTPGPCMVMTATFGSPLAREVALVRDFRDTRIKQSYTGTRFMQAFDAAYYSFSPAIAVFITDTPVIRPLVQVALMPLLAIVSLSKALYSLFAFSPDLAAVVTIISGSAMVGIVYVILPVLVILGFRHLRGGRIPGPAGLKPFAAAWAVVVILLAGGIVLSFDLLTTISSGLLVILTIFLSSAFISLALAERVLNCPAPAS